MWLTGILALWMLQALSETAGPAPLPAAGIPPLSCIEPKITPRASVPAEDLAYMQGRVNAYTACIKTYVDARRSEMEADQARAAAEADAANEATKSAQAIVAKAKAFSTSTPAIERFSQPRLQPR